MALMLYGKLFALLPMRPNIDLVLCDFEKIKNTLLMLKR